MLAYKLDRLPPAACCGTNQVNDTGRGLLVTGEEETLASVGGPGNVVESSLGVLLALLVGLKRLGLEGLVAEEEELLAGNQVPVESCISS